jgi:hypothetical protein
MVLKPAEVNTLAQSFSVERSWESIAFFDFNQADDFIGCGGRI